MQAKVFTTPFLVSRMKDGQGAVNKTWTLAGKGMFTAKQGRDSTFKGRVSLHVAQGHRPTAAQQPSLVTALLPAAQQG